MSPRIAIRLLAGLGQLAHSGTPAQPPRAALHGAPDAVARAGPRGGWRLGSGDECAGADAPGLGARRRVRAGPLTVSLSAGDVVVRRGGRGGRADYSAALDPPYDACVGVVDAQALGATTYALLWVSGNSRAQPAQGECAGGNESRLLWYAFGPRLTVARRQTVVYLSCLGSMYPDNPERFVDGRLRIAGASVRDGRERPFVVQYDRRAPERGLSVDTAAAGR